MKANPHPRDPARAARGGHRFRVRVARVKCERVLAELSRTSSRQRILLHAELRTARRIRLGASSKACASRSTTPTCSKAGRSCSAAARSSCASTPGVGRGHHHHVRTAGAHSKFGVPLSELRELAALAQAAGARIVGLHAHNGSGVFDVTNWEHTARAAGRRCRAVSRTCGSSTSAAASACRSGRTSRAWTSRKLDTLLLARARGASAARDLDRAGALSRRRGRRAAGARHAAQDQGRRALRRRRPPE